MNKIKICGLRRDEDIEMINRHDVDYVGFILAPSKRRITPEQLKHFISNLKDGIKTVGVFVNEDISEVNRIAEFAGLDIVQLHGEESIEDCKKAKFPVWKAFGVKDSSIEKTLEEYKEHVELFLLDAYDKNAKGGTGKSFNWDILNGFKENYKIALAGGLKADNIKAAIEQINPYLLDLSSGAETDGFKDEAKVIAILKELGRE